MTDFDSDVVRLRHVPVVEKKAWKARVLGDEYKASLLRLSAAHYGDKEQGLEAYVDWLKQGGPAGEAFVALAVAADTEEVIGFNWHVPMYVNSETSMKKCYMGCNGLMHPGYRRQGIYVKLYDFILQVIAEEGLFIYGFPKPAAVIPLTKVDYMQVGKIPLLVRPLQMAEVARAQVDNNLVRWVLRTGWAVAGRTVWRPRAMPTTSTPLRINVEAGFDESFDHFWQRVADKYKIMMRRDRAFLHWRFRAPAFRRYHILSARQGGELAGYAVLRTMDIEGVRTGLLMDLLVEPGERGDAAGRLLVAEATEWFREQGSHMASALMLTHTHEYDILRQAGFVVCPERLAPQPFRLSAKNLARQISDEMLIQSKNWFITMANHDAA